MMTRKKNIYYLVLLMLPLWVACNFSRNDTSKNDEIAERGNRASEIEQDNDISAGEENLLSTIENYDMLGRLHEAAKASGVSEELEKEGPYTVLAPANVAFEQAKNDEIGDMPDSWSQEQIAKVLASHIVKGSYQSTDLTDTVNLVAINGSKIQIIGKDHLLQTNIQASNGIIHVIDTLLVRPD